MTEYRIITPEYKEEMFELAKYAFNIPITENLKNQFNLIFDNSISVGAFQETGTLSGQVMITAYEVYLHKQVYKMGGIGLVANYPEYRGDGDIASLMKLALKTMNEKEDDLSYLAPFLYSFYRKYGYEHAFDQVKLTLTPDELPKAHKQKGTMKRVDWKTGSHELKKLYQIYQKDSIGPVRRADWWWSYNYDYNPELKIAIYYNPENQPYGYLTYETEGQNKTFRIKELVYLDYHAYDALWGFIASHNGSFSYFEYSAGINQNQSYLLSNPRIKQEIIPSMMVRIVNMKRFIEKFNFTSEIDNPLYLKVKDEVAPWNDGLWKLEINSGQTSLTEVTNELEEGLENQILTGDIGAWTQVFMNYRSLKELHFFNRIEGPEAAVQTLAAQLPDGSPTLYDYF